MAFLTHAMVFAHLYLRPGWSAEPIELDQSSAVLTISPPLIVEAAPRVVEPSLVPIVPQLASSKRVTRVLREAALSGSGRISGAERTVVVASANNGDGPGELIKSDVPMLPLRAGKLIGTDIDLKGVQKTIEGRLSEVRYCYERSMTDDPGRFGVVRLEMAIDQNGDVEDVQLEDETIADEAFSRCLVGKVKRWSFPKPHTSRAIVRYPLLLNRAG